MRLKTIGYIFAFILVPILAGQACSFLDEKAAEDRKAAGDDGSTLVMLSGFDVEGNDRTCPEVICSPDTSVSSPPQAFTDRCATENKVVKTCACGDWVCVDPSTLPPPSTGVKKQAPGVGEFSGYDMKGNHVSCTPTGQEIACTLIYGPEEEFADRCIKAGHQKFDCGCHDYLCSKPVE